MPYALRADGYAVQTMTISGEGNGGDDCEGGSHDDNDDNNNIIIDYISDVLFTVVCSHSPLDIECLHCSNKCQIILILLLLIINE